MRRPTPGVRLKNTGFTLLELLVVLVLAAITVSVVGGGAQSFMERARYHQTVRDVATHLKQARTLCIQNAANPIVAVLQWDAAERRPKDASGAGEILFVFNADGGARGGRLAVLRGGQGVVFHVNWLFGTVEQATVVAGS